jgi:hypothetical protein
MLTQVGVMSVAARDGHRLAVAKRLKYEAKSNAASLVTALLQHPAYREPFRTSDSAQHAGAEMHGPLVLSEIRIEDFEPIDAHSARQAIEAFLSDDSGGSPQPGATEPITQLITELDLDHSKTLHLDASGAGRRDDFQEFVVINPEVRIVTLLVLRIDA